MASERDIELVDDLRRLPNETSWLEFKHNNEQSEMIGKLVSAVSNSARYDGKGCGYVIWGIEDDGHSVVGTLFDPFQKKVGNQEFEIWLASQLQPRPAFEFREVFHSKGRLLILEIPAATAAPTAFNGVPYIRVGSATPRLTDQPERYQRLIEKMRPYSWENGFAASYVTDEFVLTNLDYPAYFSLTKQVLPDNRQGILERLSADRLISQDVGQKWNITNLGAALFAIDLDKFGPSMARKGVRFIAYKGVDRTSDVTHRQDGKKGYAAGFEGLLSYLNALLPRSEHIGLALREAHPRFPELAIRELVANALIHQDMTITGAGPQIELFRDRLEVTNPGVPLMETNRKIDLPPRSRNEGMASLMRRMGMCEEQGSGMDKVFAQVEFFQLPPPLLQASDSAMRVVLYGPRTFAEMTSEERVRACYFHSVLRFLAGEIMKNTTLCTRLGIAAKMLLRPLAYSRKL